MTKKPLTGYVGAFTCFLPPAEKVQGSSQMKELYGRLIMVTDTIPTL